VNGKILNQSKHQIKQARQGKAMEHLAYGMSNNHKLSTTFSKDG